MIRLRFEHAAQIFKNDAGKIVLPYDEITKDLVKEYGDRLIAEIPALVWEDSVDKLKTELKEVKKLGVKDVQVENIGGISIAKELGFDIHVGATLNILNSVALKEYEKLGAKDAVMTFELSLARLRKIKHDIPIGIIGYGYLPVMKLRSCPARDEKGCGECGGNQILTDRMDEQFRLMCHKKQYSELLNCVPVYIADKSIPDIDFQTLYFTVESKEEAEKIYNQYINKETPEFRRTAGLYFRELQ